MLDGIEVNVIDVPLEISLVPYCVFPESTLPKSEFAVLMPRDRSASLDDSRGEPALDQMPSIWKISISVRQCHYDMKVIGQHHYCVDHERVLPPR